MNRTVVAALALFVAIWIYPEWSHAGPELKVTAYEAGLDCEGCGGAPAKAASMKGDGGTVLAPAKAASVKEGDGGTKVAAPGEGTAIAPVAEAAPAVQYVIAAVVTVEDKPVWFGILQTAGPFDDKAACDAMLDDPGVKKANDGLAVKVLEIHPDAKVGVSCKAIPTE